MDHGRTRHQELFQRSDNTRESNNQHNVEDSWSWSTEDVQLVFVNSLRSEFCSFSSCVLQSSTRGSGGEPCSSACCPASPFSSAGPARLLRLIAARGTTILTASTSVQASRLTLPKCSTPRG
ncbi:hypothetical protein INR49_016314 [Caranx melampygus]|nr:hypothetical protein INR49_016314 [Caranx melampygus]